MKRHAVLAWLGVVIMLVAGAPATGLAESTVADWRHDVVVTEGTPAAGLAFQAGDPLGLVPGFGVTTAYTQSTDAIDLWTCGSAIGADAAAGTLDAEVGDYFADHSRGSYRPVFTVRGSAGSDSASCQNHARNNASAGAEAAVIIVAGGGGVASNLFCGTELCSGWASFPSNNRLALVGEQFLSTTAAHEIGHLIQWPHSYTGASDSEYDNAMDVMSGNHGRSGNRVGTFALPYETAAINRYAAGWITSDQVLVVDPAGDEVVLSATASGMQMAVLWDSGSFYTFSARAKTAFDPIDDDWEGVEVYRVTPCTDSQCLPGFRRISPHPAVAFEWGDFAAYEVPPAHVIPAGVTRDIGGVSVKASGGDGAFTVTFGAGADPGPGTGGGGGGGSDDPTDPIPPGSYDGSFGDDDGSVFEADIEWLAATGVTKGCNPPLNDRFCPDESVTRGQMAAFLRRALPGLTATSRAGAFHDDDGSVFESDIAWLAERGVTSGCNPPANDRFCSDEPVTRGQMAAFLHRALSGLPAPGSAVSFADSDSSVFVADIGWLAQVGVTRGCNPPGNDRFCPDEPVTRGQMAAFLRRALDN
ncbi:MAG: S-layer homology domain-containing protein [Acidimicrobiia bacterium]|nr:S-layer homology domain-containing protein [Acidimicrobiia bacterium]MDH4306001.1 S-layer homology domain-containing protein [Acidimicrobiia bacterium]MDH5292188.1 S-layer homology domain-containing protein [Acidimicrobiia bacterium]